MANKDILNALMDEGKTLHFENKHAQACEAFARAVQFAEASWSPNATEMIRPLVFLAMAVGEREAGGHARIAEVLELEQRALGIVRKHFGDNDPRMAFVLRKIGETHWRLDMHEDARERIEKAVNIFAKFYGDVESTVYYLQLLGDLLLDMNRPEEALPLCERALHIEETHGKDTLRVMHAAIGVGRCLRGIGKMEDAAMQFERALAIVIARRPPDAKREASICSELREWIAEARAKP